MTSATEVRPQPPPVAGAAPDPAADWPVTVLERRPGWQPFDLRELWRFRELLYFLMWRDIKVRYKQTALGVLWAVLQPLLLMLIFTLLLGRVAGLAKSSPHAVPYPVLVFAGLTPWTRRNFARWMFEDYPRAVLFTPRRWRRRMFTRPGAYASIRPDVAG